MRLMSIVAFMIATASQLHAAAPAAERPRTAEREAMDELYSVMATMPVADRRVIFHGLTPSAKAALWAVHLETFSAGHDLSAEQKAMVAEAAALFSPAMYAVDRANPNWERLVHAPLQEFDQKAKAIFPRDLAIEAFAQLGPGDATGIVLPAAIPGNRLTPQVQGLKPGLKPAPLMPSNCTCSTDSDWCWGFMSCGIGGTTCYLSVDGCGTGWTYSCNSSCSYGR